MFTAYVCAFTYYPKLELSWYIVCVKVVSTSLFLLSSSPLISTHTEALPKPEAIAFGRTWVSRGYTSTLIDGQRRSLRRATRAPQRKNQGHLVVKGRPPQSPQPPAIINRTISWEGLQPPAIINRTISWEGLQPPSNHQQNHFVGRVKGRPSIPPSLQQPSAKRARTSTEEEDMYQWDKESNESDYFLVSMKPVWCSGNHSSVSIKPEWCIYISSFKGFSPHHIYTF